MREALTVSSVGDSSLFLSSRMLSSDPTWSRISSHRFRRNSRAQVSYKSPPSRTQASLPLKSPPRPKVSFMTKVSSWTKGLLLHQRILLTKSALKTKYPPCSKYPPRPCLLLDQSISSTKDFFSTKVSSFIKFFSSTKCSSSSTKGLLLVQRCPSRPKVYSSTKSTLQRTFFLKRRFLLNTSPPHSPKNPSDQKHLKRHSILLVQMYPHWSNYPP